MQNITGSTRDIIWGSEKAMNLVTALIVVYSLTQQERGRVGLEREIYCIFLASKYINLYNLDYNDVCDCQRRQLECTSSISSSD